MAFSRHPRQYHTPQSHEGNEASASVARSTTDAQLLGEFHSSAGSRVSPSALNNRLDDRIH